ncbi:MAG TPA: hypothetical protein VH164_03195 [Ktedonobacteraceae bacterium]|nr:hypothetical protein [Ktedonobacteraceae bacterium]
MSQPKKRGWLASMSPLTRTILGLAVIAAAIILGVIYGPHYDVDNTTTGDSPPPTVTVSGLAGSLNVNRSIVYQGVTVTVTSVEQASSFSDDGKSQYAKTKYVLRVYLHVQAPAQQQGPLGIKYPDLARLVLSNGTPVQSNMVQISPDILPGQNEQGFMDFWINAPLNLSSLTFSLAGNTIAFGA